MIEENIIKWPGASQTQSTESSNLNVQSGDEIELKTRAILKRNIGILLKLLPIFLCLSFMALFMFDASGSTNSLPTMISAYSSLLYIPFSILSIVLSYLLCNIRQYKFAVFVSYLPFINVIGFIVGFFLIMFVCGGSFVCRW